MSRFPIAAARVPLVQRIEMAPHLRPHVVLLFRVSDLRHRTLAVVERRARDLVAPAPVDRIVKAGMIGIELQKFRGGSVVDPRLRAQHRGGKPTLLTPTFRRDARHTPCVTVGLAPPPRRPHDPVGKEPTPCLRKRIRSRSTSSPSLAASSPERSSACYMRRSPERRCRKR